MLDIDLVSKKIFKLFYGNFGAKITLVINALLGQKDKPSLNVHLDENGAVKIVNVPKDISGNFEELKGIRVFHDDESSEMRFVILDALLAVRRGVPKLVEQVNEEFSKLDEEHSGIRVEINLEKKKRRKRINPKLLSRKGVRRRQIFFEMAKKTKKKRSQFLKVKKRYLLQEKKKRRLKLSVLNGRYWKSFQFKRQIKKILRKVMQKVYAIQSASSFDRVFGTNRHASQPVIHQPVNPNVVIEHRIQYERNMHKVKEIEVKVPSIEPVGVDKISENMSKKSSESYNSKVLDFLKNNFSKKGDSKNSSVVDKLNNDLSDSKDYKKENRFNHYKVSRNEMHNKKSGKLEKNQDLDQTVSLQNKLKEMDLRKRYNIDQEESHLSTSGR